MLNELLKLLDKGPDNALLRFSIASAYLKEDQVEQALVHLEKAVEIDPRYSAAWKLYGKTLLQKGEEEQAEEVLVKGIKVASERGDIQASKEMEVFLRRLHKGI